MNLEVVEWGVPASILVNLSIQPTICDEIRENQAGDVKLDRIREKIKQRKDIDFKIHEDGSLRYEGRWCVPQKCEEVKRKLMEKGHNTPYSVHPGGDKLYKDLKKMYWWPRMKNEVAEFVTKCLNCQKETWKMEQLAKAYIKNFVRLHGVPKDIVSDRDFSYHASIGMAPFEALYGRKCRSPVCWSDISETMILGPKMIEDTVKKVKEIQVNIQAAQDRQKSYADLKRREEEFEVGDKVLLKVSPMKGVMRFGKKMKTYPKVYWFI
ncbi:uncharacterized protein LOC110728632 [Chenopodium quinoa]|uniref:uncharacterized protein LOC110728632 n=1 Tax=Chenopodium quinoa TaxID=63459 RepID=UPI000B799590|nr:uncharacterized protein LOC110728632 [Chenopodium quinoa]